ncbi:spore germination protein [Paenibacillus filicis]|uniref:Spore germination protein n=1 Tax=Paenibacillus filicis TaxID=669464 RepID=A0ABU9DEA9_9BACL
MNENHPTGPSIQKGPSGSRLSGAFEADAQFFKTTFDRSTDIVFKELLVCDMYQGLIIFIDGLVDASIIDEDVILPLLKSGSPLNEGYSSDEYDRNVLNFIQKNIISASQTKLEGELKQLTEAIASGDTVFILEGSTDALLISIRKKGSRSVEESPSEPVIRGPREGFTENLRTNTSMIRRRLQSSKLKIEALKIGEISNTDIVMVYVDGIVEESMLTELRERLGRIRIDAVLESGYIEELIEDNPYSVFPQTLSTERPDRVAAAILEGKIGIMIDNTPFALIVPITFMGLLQSPEDYYQRYMISTATRWLRYWLAIIALTFPSIYIAVTTFHQEMVPTNLLLSIAASREAVPFPAIIEAFLMELAFEGLREAGIRMPRPVGQAVSIVGALVIGQAAVQAGIVSATLVIIVSFTGIASFIFPTYSLGIAARLLRFPLMLLAGNLGLYGIFLGLLVICIHLLKLRSFGVPYLAPLAPFSFSGLKDSLVRAPWWNMIKRPVHEAQPGNLQRMRRHLKPQPPEQQD